MDYFKATIFTFTLVSLCPFGAASAQAPEVSVNEAQSSIAQDTSVEWVSLNFSAAFSGNAVKKDLLYKPFAGDAIYTNQPNASGNVSFSCFRGTLAANVGLIPTDFENLFADPPRSRRRKARSVDLVIDGEDTRSTTWSYVPAMKIYMPQKKSVVRKLYNAVIRRSVVTAGTDYNDPVTLLLPKPNAAFADFGAECGLGRKAKNSGNTRL